MKPLTTFRIRWAVKGKEEVTEFRAASAEDAHRAFNAHRLPGVSVISIEPIEPDASAPPVSNRSPISPFGPLKAQRRLDKDEDAR
jgi:hypothetical protein